MLTKAILATFLIAIPQFAQAASVSGNAALSLAQHSPSISNANKWRLRQYLNNHHAGPAAPTTITVDAASIHCRTSNVDLTSHDCELAIGTHSIVLKGRIAHELYATIVENGIVPDGTAGHLNVLLNGLSCTIKPHELDGGGGAGCIYTP
jgi:hypothetical protein